MHKFLSLFITVFFAIPFTFGLYINMAFATTNLPQYDEKKPYIIELKDNIYDNSDSIPPATPTLSNTPQPTVTQNFTQTPQITPSVSSNNNDNYSDNELCLNDELVTVNVFIKDSDEVVKMNLHDYLICVVAAEMPVTFEYEALKAQAVAARTFTVKHMSSSCSSNSKAHVCTYHGCCQAYVSVEKMKKNWQNDFNEKYDKVCQAVEDTDSLIMTYNNEPITVFYFSTSNGYTEACQDVFVKNLPYYKSVISLGEEKAPNYHSYVKISKKEFCYILKNKFGIELSENGIEQSLDIKHTPGHRVDYIYFNGVGIRGTAFRSAFGLKSADFRFTFFDDYILIDVYGYGHGVGMSQLGANSMAKNGDDFSKILCHYYIDVKLTSMK